MKLQEGEKGARTLTILGNSTSLDRMQLGRWRMGIWLSRNVPVLPVQAPNGEGRNDARHGDSQ